MAFKRVLIANRGEIALRIPSGRFEIVGIEAAIIHGREDRLSLPVTNGGYCISNNENQSFRFIFGHRSSSAS